MREEEDAIVVLVTAGSHDEAAKIARSVVEERLAACVNIVPGLRSIYRWKGQVADDAEWLLVMKTSRARFAAGSRPYLDWLLGSVATA